MRMKIKSSKSKHITISEVQLFSLLTLNCCIFQVNGLNTSFAQKDEIRKKKQIEVKFCKNVFFDPALVERYLSFILCNID